MINSGNRKRKNQTKWNCKWDAWQWHYINASKYSHTHSTRAKPNVFLLRILYYDIYSIFDRCQIIPSTLQKKICSKVILFVISITLAVFNVQCAPSISKCSQFIQLSLLWFMFIFPSWRLIDTQCTFYRHQIENSQRFSSLNLIALLPASEYENYGFFFSFAFIDSFIADEFGHSYSIMAFFS